MNGGCSESNATVFQQAVRHYYSEPFDFDFGKFPKPINGFYLFSSTPELVAALPHHLGKTRHTFDFNCMDMVIVTAADRLRTTLQPDDISGPFMVSTSTTNGTGLAFLATPRDAFTWGYMAQYRDASEALIPKSMQDARICLTACLYRWYVLPMSTTEDNLESNVLAVLRTTWKSETVQFPGQFQVIFVHGADAGTHLFSTEHAGLLFPRKSGYTYIEKAGGSGPFVRLDVENKSDLTPWLSAAFVNPKQPNGQRFATFNGDTIQNLNPK